MGALQQYRPVGNRCHFICIPHHVCDYEEKRCYSFCSDGRCLSYPGPLRCSNQGCSWPAFLEFCSMTRRDHCTLNKLTKFGLTVQYNTPTNMPRSFTAWLSYLGQLKTAINVTFFYLGLFKLVSTSQPNNFMTKYLT
ncbi:hypothetical protein AVEN_126510-1 [Araneus ventricosus]|uniref:Uncharacterized protein n=1 Tax=Araneus ventricosus TaxID=182803 RepID=A0A4Y2LSS4_ARAVE|nr:hypothetical protein AVEN_126510-1 [Araneus ventricosus]